MLDLTYLVPIRSDRPDRSLVSYLSWLGTVVEHLLVVDSSDAEVFAAHRSALPPVAEHVPLDPALRTPMGKVGGVLTGLARARHDAVVIADDDVRWTEAQLGSALARLADAEVVRPQNRFISDDERPLPWHARWDTGRMLLARALGGDWPGTLAVRRSALPDGYSGDALFENLELVRTVVAGGGREHVALDLIVDRLPPTTRHFVGQRVRQAYDEWARPGWLAAELALVPSILIGRRRAVVGLAAGAILVAELGRRRAGGRAAFGPGAALWAPAWLVERGVTSWLAVGARARGGARYRDGRLPLAAHSVRALRSRAVVVSRPEG